MCFNGFPSKSITFTGCQTRKLVAFGSHYLLHIFVTQAVLSICRVWRRCLALTTVSFGLKTNALLTELPRHHRLPHMALLTIIIPTTFFLLLIKVLKARPEFLITRPEPEPISGRIGPEKVRKIWLNFGFGPTKARKSIRPESPNPKPEAQD